MEEDDGAPVRPSRCVRPQGDACLDLEREWLGLHGAVPGGKRSSSLVRGSPVAWGEPGSQLPGLQGSEIRIWVVITTIMNGRTACQSGNQVN
jgi:hypothetical protein